MDATGEVVDRVAEARRRCTEHLRDLFARAGLVYPARTILLRAFKLERQLEVWGSNDPTGAGEFRLVKTYPILGASGVLGPKRCEGDRQVPEGFYRVNRFNPRSHFHLSLGLDYPNAADLICTTNPQAPGSDIFIHGGTESKGCLAMGDAAMEEIYLLARDAGEVFIHVYPCRLDEANQDGVLTMLGAENAALVAFWRELEPVYHFFERHRCLPSITVYPDGRYLCGMDNR